MPLRPTRVGPALLAMLLLGACAVRFVSPYNEEIARRAARLHDEVITFEFAMRRQAGTRQGDPRAEANRERFEAWRASVDTMAALSAASDPRVVRCQELLSRLAGAAERIDPAVAQGLREQDQAADAARADCQTFGVVRLGQQLGRLERLYDEHCRVPGLDDAAFGEDAPRRAAPARKLRLPACDALFAPLPSAAALGLSGPHGLAIDAVLRSIRAVILVQEGKRPGS